MTKILIKALAIAGSCYANLSDPSLIREKEDSALRLLNENIENNELSRTVENELDQFSRNSNDLSDRVRREILENENENSNVNDSTPSSSLSAYSKLKNLHDRQRRSLQDKFEVDMLNFEQQFAETAKLLGLNTEHGFEQAAEDFVNSEFDLGDDSFSMDSLLDMDFQLGEDAPVARSEGLSASAGKPSRTNLPFKNLSKKTKLDKVNNVEPKPMFQNLNIYGLAKNDTRYIKIVADNLKKEINDQQKEEVEKLEKLEMEDPESMSKQESMQLALFRAMAERIDDDRNKITGRSSVGGSGSSSGMSAPSSSHIQQNIGYFLDNIWNYGCWCYFGDNMKFGRGKPVNEMDATCRALNYCYTCVRLDEKENSNTCLPGKVQYNRPVSLDEEAQQQAISCEKANEGDSCKINTCRCETQFISKLISFFFDPEHIFEPEYKHDKKVFDPNSCGPLPPHLRGLDGDDNDDQDHPNDYGNGGYRGINNILKNPQGERQCCGEYPDRKPYNTAIQGCCKGTDEKAINRIFRIDGTLQCCRDGHIRMVCPDYVD